MNVLPFILRRTKDVVVPLLSSDVPYFFLSRTHPFRTTPTHPKTSPFGSAGRTPREGRDPKHPSLHERDLDSEVPESGGPPTRRPPTPLEGRSDPILYRSDMEGRAQTFDSADRHRSPELF